MSELKQGRFLADRHMPDGSVIKNVGCVHEADHDRVVAELTRVRDAWTDRARNSEARLAAIQIERDALAADARRYRWLRSADSGIDAIAHRTPISNTGATCVTLLEGEGLDTAIDAALTKAGFPTK